MREYLAMLDHVLTRGVKKADRTGTGTLAVFDYTMKFDMADGFPLVTTKRVNVRSVIYELLWFLKGEQDISFLKENGVNIWNNWADEEDGWVGPIYGKQWRNWAVPGAYSPGIDQIDVLIQGLKTNPNSRRHVVSAWNVAQLDMMALMPCHFAFQCVVFNNQLHMKVFLRSLDIFLGAPFDIASYAFLLHILAELTNLTPGELVISSTDTHLYLNHIEQAKLQLTREPFARPAFQWVLPIQFKNIDDVTYNDLATAIRKYNHHDHITATISV